MPGKWIKTQQRNRKAVTGTTELETDIPSTNFIGSIEFMLSGLGHATQTLLTLEAAVSIAELRVDGIVIKRLTGAQVRALMVKHGKVSPNSKTSTTTTVDTWCVFELNFGRFENDEEFILPAKLYEDIVMRLEFNATNLGYFTTASYIDVITNEYVSNDNMYSKTIIKEKQFKTIASGTTEIKEKIEKQVLAELMLYVSALDGNEFGSVTLEMNQGSHVPFKTTVMKMIANQERTLKLPSDAKTALVASGALTTAYMFLLPKEPINLHPYNDTYIVIGRAATATAAIVTVEYAKPEIKSDDINKPGQEISTPPHMMG